MTGVEAPGASGAARRRERAGEALMFLANLVYATSYVASRLALDSIPPATLGFLRLAVGALVLLPPGRPSTPRLALSRADRRRVAWMGIVGFGVAYALTYWGLARSTATNAALLIVVEPIALILLAPLALGERLGRRETAGAVVTLAGTVLVVANGIPGLTERLVPYWRGDLLLLLSGVAFAAYSLIGRDVLARHAALPVTRRSLGWGALAMLPLVAAEWVAGHQPTWTATAVATTLYLGVVLTGLGFLVWNHALRWVPAPRAAVFLNLQPIVGALLGVWLLHEPLTPFTVAGGLLVVAGLWLTVTARGR
jgi:drug/metabolite transporter (DMT)-like permease